MGKTTGITTPSQLNFPSIMVAKNKQMVLSPPQPLNEQKKKKKWDLSNLKKNANEFREYIAHHIKRSDGKEVEERWNNIKSVVNQAAKNVVGYKKNLSAKKPWVTQEMLDKMAERWRYKNVNTESGRQMYRRLNNELRRETEREREIWWES